MRGARRAIDILSILEFNNQWIELGIINDEKLRQFEVDWSKGEDPYPEHYRWRAFLDFIKSKEQLDENTAKALYVLEG